MKKQILYILTFIFIPVSLLATDYTTQGNGTWTNTSTWNNTGYPDDASDNALLDNNHEIEFPGTGIKITIGKLEFDNNSSLLIPVGDTLVCDSISIWNNATITINGVLEVNGGFHMNNNSALTLNASGSVEIGGDFEGTQNVDLYADGPMHVAGDFTLGSNSTVDGAAGSITVDGTVTMPDGIDPKTVVNGTLPIELIKFSGDYLNNYIMISWTTASEINNDFYTIERSKDGKEFYSIGMVYGAGNSNKILNYEFIDYNTSDETTYYRLKQTDFNGKFEYSKVIAVQRNEENALDIKLVNNSTSRDGVELFSEIQTNATLTITSINGSVLERKELELVNGYQFIEFEKTVSAGIYLVTITTLGNRVTKKLIKN